MSPARVLARTSGEVVLESRIAGVQPVEVTLRLDRLTALIDTDWRLMWLGWPFGVTAVAVDELAAVVTLLAVRSRGASGEAKAVRVANLARFKARLLAIVDPQAIATLRKANAKNAQDFRDTVARSVPRGDPEDGQLVDTLTVREYPPTATGVSIGDEKHPYPLHLETGHRARDGTHVPGKKYWFPSKQATKKRAHNRLLRAERAIIKSAVAHAGMGASDE